LVWQAKDIVMGNGSEHRLAHLDIPISTKVQHNASLFAHIYLARKGVSLDEHSSSHQRDAVVHTMTPLIHYLQRPKIIQRTNLILGDSQETEETEHEKEENASKEEKKEEESPIISYWWGNLTVNILNEAGSIPFGQLTPNVRQLFQLDPLNRTTSSGKAHMYMPLIYPNDFWRLRDHMIPVNETLTSLPLRVEYYPLSMIKLQMYEQLGDSLQKQQSFYGGSSGETDELKRMLLETNPWILAFTILVTTLHSLFDMLAFKNDIAYWKQKKDQVGVSVRSILLNVGFQAVIFLYLLDNEKSTSWMILISQGIGLVIELWKVTKALNIKLTRREGGRMAIHVERKEKADMSETESKTAQYDAEAFRYLSWIAYPLLAGYALYSLLYDTHKSWYSFVLS
ncbi:cleft lip and palate transmembrane 1, partial [Piptocephalis cylindrospora]